MLINFYRNQKKVEYTGGRTKDAIIQWITKKSGPPSALSDCDTIKEKIADKNLKFVMVHFGHDDEDTFMHAHNPVADVEDKITFLHNHDASCAEHFGTKHPSIVFFRDFETEVNIYEGPADQESLQKFFKPLMVATLFKFTEDEIEAVFGQQQNTIVMFRTEEQADEPWVKSYEQASKDLKGEFLFAYSDKTVEIQEKLAEFMGVTDEDLPCIRMIMPANMTKYAGDVSRSTWNTEGIKIWLDRIRSGDLQPHMKSAEIPATNDGPVYELVGKEFNGQGRSASKDVFVKFYAPWCGHCKKLAPIWEELGEHFKDVSTFRVAKFDSTVNEANAINIRGYPTLQLFKSGEQDGITYEGERDLESMIKWIEENSPNVKSFRASAAGTAEASKEDL